MRIIPDDLAHLLVTRFGFTNAEAAVANALASSTPDKDLALLWREHLRCSIVLAMLSVRQILRYNEPWYDAAAIARIESWLDEHCPVYEPNTLAAMRGFLERVSPYNDSGRASLMAQMSDPELVELSPERAVGCLFVLLDSIGDEVAYQHIEQAATALSTEFILLEQGAYGM